MAHLSYGSAEATSAAFAAAAAAAAYSASDPSSFFRVPSAGYGSSSGRKRKPESPYGPQISSVIRLSPTSLVSFANGSCSSSASGSYGHLSAGKLRQRFYCISTEQIDRVRPAFQGIANRYCLLLSLLDQVVFSSLAWDDDWVVLNQLLAHFDWPHLFSCSNSQRNQVSYLRKRERKKWEKEVGGGGSSIELVNHALLDTV